MLLIHDDPVSGDDSHTILTSGITELEKRESKDWRQLRDKEIQSWLGTWEKTYNYGSDVALFDS